MKLPGADLFSASLSRQLDKQRQLKGSDYKPRTRHLLSDGSPRYTNRLFLETSPYLIQHAHNPVNWFPWCDEAFETARRLNRPVLLSIGYSTCHWCHVMEEESFEDVDVARYLNENYVAIKIDREERPDIDSIYMSAVMALTGVGGWPLNVWLTHDRKPFFGGTYFPPDDGETGSRVGFLTLLKKMREIYDAQPDKISESGHQLSSVIRQILSPAGGEILPGVEIEHKAAKYYKEVFDVEHGGLEGEPKFPSSLPIRFLLRYYKKTGDRDILNMVTLTLDRMSQSGMYDHIGGGFHRYATDRNWLIPHFEKMLYDNALLVLSYLEAWQATGKEDYERIVREILLYVDRDMTAAPGGFYSATDADSPGFDGIRKEGLFFTWSAEEINEILADKDALFIKQYYGITQAGNFEGRNILNTPLPLDDIASQTGISIEDAGRILNDGRTRLYSARSRRPPPLRDEKILTSWNSLMISAYARAGLFLAEEDYVKTASKGAHFIMDYLYRDGQLFHSFKDGKSRIAAYLDDYAFLICALIDLYEATGHIAWLEQAINFDRFLEDHFEDKRSGGFFRTSDEHELLIAREKPAYDGAEPSGNSAALLNLLRLHEFTAKRTYRERAIRALKAFTSTLDARPFACSEMLNALDFHLDEPKDIVILTPADNRKAADSLLSRFSRQFLPNCILAVVEDGSLKESIASIVPIVRGKVADRERAVAYVCIQGTCHQPTSDPAVFSDLIR